MRYMFRHLILAVCLWMGVAHAAPNTNATDDIEKFLADRGLISQMEQLRQRMSQQASDLVVNAMGFLGVPYRRGGNTAESGFDCSGFVRAMYEQTVGLVLPRRARDQAAATETIERKDLQPGDLVFFNTMRTKFSHVGIYLGDNKFIHSPKPGEQVRIDDMRQAYWDRRFNGARRVKDAGGEKVVN
jgi:cell wall-associated NlpC family hydrolase